MLGLHGSDQTYEGPWEEGSENGDCLEGSFMLSSRAKREVLVR